MPDPGAGWIATVEGAELLPRVVHRHDHAVAIEQGDLRRGGLGGRQIHERDLVERIQAAVVTRAGHDAHKFPPHSPPAADDVPAGHPTIIEPSKTVGE